MTPDVFLIMTPYRLRHYDAFRSPLLVTCFPKIVIQNGGKNALWESRETGQWHRVKNSITRMTSYRFPYHSSRSFTFASDDAWRFPHYDAISSNRHSERGQECCLRKQGDRTVTQSEESITLMTSYRFPHHSSRSFAVVSYDTTGNHMLRLLTHS